MLGVVPVDARGCEPPSFDVCLPCDACISGGFSGCFSGFFLVGFGLFGPGAARAPLVLPAYLAPYICIEAWEKFNIQY